MPPHQKLSSNLSNKKIVSRITPIQGSEAAAALSYMGKKRHRRETHEIINQVVCNLSFVTIHGLHELGKGHTFKQTNNISHLKLQTIDLVLQQRKVFPDVNHNTA